MYSDVSQNCVVGASARMYKIKAPSETHAAMRYGGRSSAVESAGIARLGDLTVACNVVIRLSVSRRRRPRPRPGARGEGGGHRSYSRESHRAIEGIAVPASDRGLGVPLPWCRIRTRTQANCSVTVRPPTLVAACELPLRRPDRPRTRVASCAGHSRNRGPSSVECCRWDARPPPRAAARALRRPDRTTNRVDQAHFPPTWKSRSVSCQVDL